MLVPSVEVVEVNAVLESGTVVSSLSETCEWQYKDNLFVFSAKVQ